MVIEELITGTMATDALAPVVNTLGISIIFIIIALIILKGVALYKAARLNEKVWFWILLIINSAAILPLIYLYLRRGRKI